MNRKIFEVFTAVALICAAAVAGAQQPMTVFGHVTSGGRPVVGARIRVPDLRIERTADADGRYSFLVPSVQVRAQSVRIIASDGERRARFAPLTATITLSGGSIEQNFDLTPLAGGETVGDTGQIVRRATIQADTADFTHVAGAQDLVSALAGRVSGLVVSPLSTLGGTAASYYRGPRSIIGTSEPLFIVDGLPVDNTVFSSLAQRFGQGGFDYGSPLADFDLANIASYRFVSGPEASALYGGRGANGVVIVTTKRGAGRPFAIEASQQFTTENYVLLPSYQNQYGQGLGGRFEFFNGRGGGINDGVAESWGPPLDGRPLAQSSYTEAGRPDIRFWSARPDNVENYFAGGRTLNSVVALHTQSDLGSLRISGGNRDTRGITPRSTLLRRNGAAHGDLRLWDRLSLDAAAFIAETRNDGAPGTGYNEGNPFSQFTRMGRQVDTDSLRVHLRDATGKPINWIYVDRNNPYFASAEDSVAMRRYHGGGSGAATFEFANGLTATALGGVDYLRDLRYFNIASGWAGGFPFYAGPGNFSKGGFEADEVAVQRNHGLFRLESERVRATTRWTTSGGVSFNVGKERVRSAGIDSAVNVPAAGAPDTAQIPKLASWTGHSRNVAAFGQTVVTMRQSTVGASLRNVWTTVAANQSASQLLPAIWGNVDLARALPNLEKVPLLKAMTLHGGWWRDAADLTPYVIEGAYGGRAPTGSIAPSAATAVSVDSDLSPELTTGLQLGAALRSARLGVQVGATYYHERTTGLILPVVDPAGGALVTRNVADMRNAGIEAYVGWHVGREASTLEWNGRATLLKNSNEIEAFSNGAAAAALSPVIAGVTLEARAGEPLGVLTGRKYLRNGAGQLILRDGLPLPDTTVGPQPLGSSQPNWVGAFSGSLRYGLVTASAIGEVRRGGSIYSLTNLWGSYAGTLEATSFRPAEGRLLAGVDAVTGRENTTRVSTEAYYHALGAIQEPWVYDASFFKLREARLSVSVPLTFAAGVVNNLNVALIGRNLFMSADVPNVDPETLLSPYQPRGLEMGQLPSTRSLGFQITVTP